MSLLPPIRGGVATAVWVGISFTVVSLVGMLITIASDAWFYFLGIWVICAIGTGLLMLRDIQESRLYEV